MPLTRYSNNYSLANPTALLEPSGAGSSKAAQEADVLDEEVSEVVEVSEMEDHQCLRSAFVSALSESSCAAWTHVLTVFSLVWPTS